LNYHACYDLILTYHLQNGTELVDGDVPFATVFSSPSKNDDGVKHRHIAAAHRAATCNAPNVNYKRLVEAGTKLASKVSGRSKEEQNTIYSVLTNLREMVHDQDYGSDKYVGTVIEPIAAKLASLCQGMAINKNTGGMKKKLVNELVLVLSTDLAVRGALLIGYHTNADFAEVVELVQNTILQAPAVQ
jgi:hypothetical protein